VRRFRVKVNDEVFEVEVEEITQGETAREARPSSAPVPAARPVNIPVPKKTTPIAPVSAPKAAPTQAASGKKSEGEAGDVVAPIPGVVSEIRVSSGKRVKKGEVLLLLEAMKMQNEILAPYDATVKEVVVSQGASVQPGDVLVRLAK